MLYLLYEQPVDDNNIDTENIPDQSQQSTDNLALLKQFIEKWTYIEQLNKLIDAIGKYSRYNEILDYLYMILKDISPAFKTMNNDELYTLYNDVIQYLKSIKRQQK